MKSKQNFYTLSPIPENPFKTLILNSHYFLPYSYLLFVLGLIYSFMFQYSWLTFIFSMGLVISFEWLLRKSNTQETTIEWTFDAGITLAVVLWTSLIISLKPQLQEELLLFLYLACHLAFTLYIRCRMGQTLNLASIFLSVQSLFTDGFASLFWSSRLTFSSKWTESRNKKIVISLVFLVSSFALILTLNQILSSLSPQFEQLTKGIHEFIYNLRLSELFEHGLALRIILALLVGSFLFGLTTKPLISEASSQASLPQSRSILPTFFGIGLLIMMVLLFASFFAVASHDISNLMQRPESAPHAYQIAIPAFWEFIQVSLINLVTLSLMESFIRDMKVSIITKSLTFILLVITLGFALLAGYKLIYLYMGTFGITPLRLLASWIILSIITHIGLRIASVRHHLDLYRQSILTSMILWILMTGLLIFY